jgi:hypothetical protein
MTLRMSQSREKARQNSNRSNSRNNQRKKRLIRRQRRPLPMLRPDPWRHGNVRFCHAFANFITDDPSARIHPAQNRSLREAKGRVRCRSRPYATISSARATIPLTQSCREAKRGHQDHHARWIDKGRKVLGNHPRIYRQGYLKVVAGEGFYCSGRR